MDGISQDVYYWRLIHHLVCGEGMTAFQVKANEKEIWIEREDVGQTTVIRLIRQDLAWSNSIVRDLEKLFVIGETIRKRLKTRHLTIINVYVSSYLPVDLPEDLLIDQTNKKITIQSFIIDSEQGHREVKKVENILGLGAGLPVPDINNFSFVDAISRYRKEVVYVSDKRLKTEEAFFTFGKPFFTYSLLVTILVVFGMLELFGSSESLLTLVEFGAKYDPLIVEGEWWRFFTAIFLHIGYLHLVMNSLALFYLGSAVERIYGTKRFILIYLLAGVFGSVSSFVFNSHISAGASGAIFGCFGALLYFGVVKRKLFFRTIGVNVIVVLMINLAFGFMVPIIDNSAHIGGLIGGFLVSSILDLPNRKAGFNQLIRLVVTVASLFLLIIYGFSIEQETETTHMINVQIAQELLQKEEIDRAYTLLKNAVDSEVDMVEVHFLLAYSEARLGLLKEAEKNLLITIEQRPYLHEAHFNLSLVYLELRQFLDAHYSVETALELNPDNKDYQQLRNTIEKHLGER